MSGHIFFADRFYGSDDAIYAAGRLLELPRKIDLCPRTAGLPGSTPPRSAESVPAKSKIRFG